MNRISVNGAFKKSYWKKSIVFFLLLIVPLLNGCWDRREVESLGLIQTLGIDPGPNGKGLTITTLIAVPPKVAGGSNGGGGGGDETGAFVISMDAPTFYEGFNLLNTTINRDLTLLQNSTLIISEDLAKKGIKKWVDNLIRFRQMRRTVLLFIAEGKAADVMNVKPKLEKNPSEYFVDLAMKSRRNGMFPYTRLHDFLSSYEAYAQESFVPYLAKYKRKEPAKEEKQNDGQSAGKSPPKPEGEAVRIKGTAVFRKDKMVGTFDLYESQVLLLLINQFREAELSIPDPLKKNNLIAFRLIRAVPIRIRYHRNSGENRFTVNLNLEVDLISIQSEINYTEPKLEKVLAKHIAKTLKNRIVKVIKKAQQEYNSDVFGFGTQVRKTMLTAQDWDNYHWPEKFKDARIKVNVKVALRRVGLQFQPPKLR